jgi:hypothetical protein
LGSKRQTPRDDNGDCDEHAGESELEEINQMIPPSRCQERSEPRECFYGGAVGAILGPSIAVALGAEAHKRAQASETAEMSGDFLPKLVR